MTQPVCNVLTRNAQRRAILHQRDVKVVRHLAAADTEIDPAHHVPQDALGVVVEFLFDLRGAPVGPRRQRRRQDIVERGARAHRQRGLHGGDVDLMIMQGMQRRGGGRGHPGRVGTRLGMPHFGPQHVGHEVRHRPHALADLGMPAKAAREAHVDVLAFISIQPDGLLQIALARYGSRFHRGVNLVTGAVEKAGVDEHDALLHRPDAFHQVDGGTPLLIHDADLQGVARQPEQVLDRREQIVGEGDLLRTMQLRLDDVDRACAGVPAAAACADVVKCDQGGDDRIDEGLRYGFAGQRDGLGLHVVSDVSHQHQAAARQQQVITAGRSIAAVLIQLAHHRPAGFFQFRRQRSRHQSQPITIDQHLVLGADGGHGVLAVLNGRDRGLEHHVADPGGIAAADEVLPVDVQFDMQAMMLEQDHGGCGRIALVADERGSVRENRGTAGCEEYLEAAGADAVTRRVAMAGGCERKALIEEASRELDHFRAALGVIPAAARRTAILRDGIRAIQGVIEAAPARIRGVQGIARIIHGDYQLGTGHGRDLGVDIGRGDFER